MQQNLAKKPIKKTFFFLLITSLIIAFDQFLKYKIRHGGGFYLCNSGISFGIQFSGVFFWLFVAIFSLFGIFYYVFLYHKKQLPHFSFLFLVGLAILVGGVLSNLTDRILLGCVLDYISFFQNFPVFNLADVGISWGSCLIIFFLLSKNR